jgi:DNA-directed RNA polymerase specialized sigma24 family protein
LNDHGEFSRQPGVRQFASNRVSVNGQEENVNDPMRKPGSADHDDDPADHNCDHEVARDHDDSDRDDESDHGSRPVQNPTTLFDNLPHDFWKRLMAFARRRRARHGLRANRLLSPEELVSEAVVRVLSGDRHYDESKPLFEFMCSVVDSLLSHSATSAVNRHTHLTLDNQDGDESCKGVINEEHVQSANDFESRLMTRDLVERLMKTLDPKAKQYLAIRLDERYTTDAERAVALNTTVDDINNRIRRIKRRVKLLNCAPKFA